MHGKSYNNNYTGKRDVPSEPMSAKNEELQTDLEATEYGSPIPFNVKEHGHRLKREVDQCDPGDKKHVLFVLDTSGSIQLNEFNTMKETVSLLTGLFCGDIEVAALTFGHEIHLEFCFGCHGSRLEERIALRDLVHRSGQSTKTGGATKCICEKMLDSSCGFDDSANSCIDVIYITDGQSNGGYEVCDEIKCLHNHALKINTYSLGIGSAFDFVSAQEELECIQDSSNQMSLFHFNTFDELNMAVQEIRSDIFAGTRSCATTGL